MEHEFDGDNNCNWYARNNLQRICTGTGGPRNERTRGDDLDYRIINIGQNTEKSPGDLSKPAVTETPVENHQLTLVWKTLYYIAQSSSLGQFWCRRFQCGQHSVLSSPVPRSRRRSQGSHYTDVGHNDRPIFGFCQKADEAMGHEGDGDTNGILSNWNSFQRFRKEAGRIADKTENRDYLDQSAVKIS